MCDSDGPAADVPHPAVCDLCRTPLGSASEIFSVVPDSSFLHPCDPDRDGLRRVAACSPEHLGEIQQHYRRRPFVKQELWAGKIARALTSQPDLDEQALVEATGLNLIQIQNSLVWESERSLQEASGEGDEDPDGGAHRTEGAS